MRELFNKQAYQSKTEFLDGKPTFTDQIGKKKNSTMLFFGIVVAFMITIFCVVFYLVVVNPAFVTKPEFEKPLQFQRLTEEHILYIANEMEFFRLHKDPFSQEYPIVIFETAETKYNVTVIGNVPSIADLPGEPDVVVSSDAATFTKLSSSPTFELYYADMLNKGYIVVEISADWKEQALKGYAPVIERLERNETR